MVVEARYAVFSIDQYITFEPTWAILHIRPHFRDLSTQILSTQNLSTFRYGPENSGVRLSHDRPMMKKSLVYGMSDVWGFRGDVGSSDEAPTGCLYSNFAKI